jgi:hypothetical protein
MDYLIQDLERRGRLTLMGNDFTGGFNRVYPENLAGIFYITCFPEEPELSNPIDPDVKL